MIHENYKKIIFLLLLITNISFSITNSEKIKLLNEAQLHLGTKYLYGAKAGNNQYFDCSSLMQYIYRKININLPRTSKEQAKLGEKIELKNLQSGDLIFFENSKGVISHVGMYIGNNKFYHASSKYKKVLISELEGYYLENFVFAKRIVIKEKINNKQKNNKMYFYK